MRERHYSYRSADGKWNREEGFWELPYFQGVNLGQESHIQLDKNG
jgi:hypothetical protein